MKITVLGVACRPCAGRSWFQSRPARTLRLALRLPIHLYHLHLGWLLGHRFILLTHKGRKTGQARQTVLEVILYEPTARESVVVSARGARADWYRNLLGSPTIEIRTGRERYTPVHRFLTPEETYTALVAYERRHPWAARVFAKVFDYPLGGSEAARRTFVEPMRLVAFRPQQRKSSIP
jgi:deazaflavin-dependent oxidoreductase (nitroreductase family)